MRGRKPGGAGHWWTVSNNLIWLFFERNLLLSRRGWRSFFKQASLVAHHRGDQLPGWAGSLAPGRGHDHDAVVAGRGIVVEETRLPGEHHLPLLDRCGRADFNQARVRGHVVVLQQPGGCDEVELVRKAHADAAFERILQFGAEIRA